MRTGEDPSGQGGAAEAAEREERADRAAIAEVEHELSVLGRKWRSLSREFAVAVHPELDPGAYALLVRLIEAGPTRASELACYFGVGKATMSRQLKVLEDLGLVGREPDPADGRAWLLRPTPEGARRVEHVRDVRQAEFHRRLGAWDRGELTELARLLRHLNGTAAD